MHEKLIRKLKQYIKLTEDEEDIVVSLFKKKKLKKGECFLNQGEVCNKLGFVVKGIMSYNSTNDGNEITYNFADENGFICDYMSMLNGTPSGKNIKAIEDSELLIITSEGLKKFYSSLHEGEKFGRLMMEQVYTGSIKQLLSLYIDSPEERYKNFLQNFPNYHQRIPQYYIASYVGVKPQSLSRIRKRLLKK